jgi:hypothetical protein
LSSLASNGSRMTSYVTEHEPGGRATVGADGVTIEFPAFGGVRTEFHRAEFQERACFVVGRAVTSLRSVLPGTMSPLLGVNRMVTGRLDTPLGGRVLVSVHGQPIGVAQRDSA